MKTNRKLIATFVIFLWTLWMGKANADQHIITFDDLSEGYAFDPIHQPYLESEGITIYGVALGIPDDSLIPRVIIPSEGTRSSPNALILESTVELPSYWSDYIEIKLHGYTSDMVHVYLGMEDTCPTDDPVTASLKGYQTADSNVLTFVPGAEASYLLGWAPASVDLPRVLSIVSPTGAIDTIRIRYYSSCAREIIDNLVIHIWEGETPPPVEDTIPPRLTITYPEPDYYTRSCFVGIGGIIEENLGIVSVTAQTSEGVFALTPYGEAREFYFLGRVRLPDSEGDHLIRVITEDVGGNTDEDSRTVHYTRPPPSPIPPPEDLNIIATGMEVTQVIQGWGIIERSTPGGIFPRYIDGSTPADLDNETDLITGKRTLVRVYAKALGTTVPIPDVRCDLIAYRASGEEFPDSPISSLNRVTLIPSEDFIYQREDPNKTFNFILPTDWTDAGEIELWATVNPFNRIRERDFLFDWANSVNLEVTFHDTLYSLYVYTYSVRLPNPNIIGANLTPNRAQCEDNIMRLLQIYPVPLIRTNVLYLGSYSSSITPTFDPNEGVYSLSDDQLTRLLWDFWDWLGFDETIVRFYPMHSVYLGLTHPDVQHTGVTTPDDPVSLSVANNSWFYRIKTTHETGHAMGLGHVQGCDAPAPDFEPYPSYTDPYGAAYHDASIGDWGVNIKPDNSITLLNPDDWRDIMSYCGNWRWMSVYTWDWLCRHFTVRSRSRAFTPRLRYSIADSQSTSLYFIVQGMIGPKGEISLKPAWRKEFPEGSQDYIGEGPRSIQLLNAEDQLLFERYFSPHSIKDLEEYAFFCEILPAFENTRKILIKGDSNNNDVWIAAGPGNPMVTLTYPQGGENWDSTGFQQITWMGNDPDNDPLTFKVLFSNDKGQNWQTVMTGIQGTGEQMGISVSLDDLPGGNESCLVQVLATDGINQGEDTSNQVFTKKGQPPQVSIIGPSTVTVFSYGETVIFEGIVTDREDESIPAEKMRWSSYRDGYLGTGPVVGSTHLSPGIHQVEFMAEDSDGKLGRANTVIGILEPEDTYTLTINTQSDPPSCNAWVTKSPNKDHYYPGEKVILSASHSPYCPFNSWSGDASGSNPTLTITMNSNKIVVAYFGIQPFIPQLSAEVNSDNTVSLTWTGYTETDFMSYHLLRAPFEYMQYPEQGHVYMTNNAQETNYHDQIPLPGVSYYRLCVMKANDMKIYSESVQVIGKIPAENHPPHFNPIAEQHVQIGSTLTFLLTAWDEDDDPLFYSVSQLPPGATLSGSQFSWTPNDLHIGEHQVIFTVKDSGDPPLSDEITVTIIVMVDIEIMDPNNLYLKIEDLKGGLNKIVIESPFALYSSYDFLLNFKGLLNIASLNLDKRDITGSFISTYYFFGKICGSEFELSLDTSRPNLLYIY